jgi:hypothetical protein
LNPYLATALAMCAIVLIAFALTAYLAVVFNRRAKADLNQALQPLAGVIDGQVDLDEAKVTGRFGGHIAEGRMATSITGPGRVFHTSVIDGAGGVRWKWTTSRSRRSGDAAEAEFEPEDSTLRSSLVPKLEALLPWSESPAHWMIIEYDPAPGHVRLTRPMQSRRDIPHVAQFEGDLQSLVAVAVANRNVQYHEE